MKKQLARQELSALFLRAQRGHEESRERVYAFLRSRLLALARYRVQEAAEDLVQETLVIVHNHLAEFETLEGMLAFTNQVLRNKVGNLYQARHRQRKRSVELDDCAEPAYRMNSSLEASELERILRESIDKLSETRPYCAAILLHLYDGFDVEEMTQRLGVSKAQLKVRTFRCRKALREILWKKYGWQV